MPVSIMFNCILMCDKQIRKQTGITETLQSKNIVDKTQKPPQKRGSYVNDYFNWIYQASWFYNDYLRTTA